MKRNVDSIVLGQAAGVEHVSFYSRTELPASIYSTPWTFAIIISFGSIPNRSELSSSEFRNGAHRILPIARIRASDQLSCLRRQLHSKLHFVSRLLQIGTILHFSFVSNSYRIVLSAQLWANPASPSDETKRWLNCAWAGCGCWACFVLLPYGASSIHLQHAVNVCDYHFFRLNSNRSELSSSELRNSAQLWANPASPSDETKLFLKIAEKFAKNC